MPCEIAGLTVNTRLHPGSVVAVADDTNVALRESLRDAGGARYDWQHDIPLVQRKAGASRNWLGYGAGRPSFRWTRRQRPDSCSGKLDA